MSEFIAACTYQTTPGHPCLAPAVTTVTVHGDAWCAEHEHALRDDARIRGALYDVTSGRLSDPRFIEGE